jgi:hypothetical protein
MVKSLLRPNQSGMERDVGWELSENSVWTSGNGFQMM